MSRDIADGEADAAVVGLVGRRAVEQQHMVQRRLAGFQFGIDGVVLVHIDGDLLAAREQVVLVERVGVLHLALVRAGDELHAT